MTGAMAGARDRVNDRGKRQGQWQVQETGAIAGAGNSQWQGRETENDRGKRHGPGAGARGRGRESTWQGVWERLGH